MGQPGRKAAPGKIALMALFRRGAERIGQTPGRALVIGRVSIGLQSGL
jgi:hypothetical protein